MFAKRIFAVVAFVLSIQFCNGQNVFFKDRERTFGNLRLKPRAVDNAIDFQVLFEGDVKLEGQLGLSLPISVGQPTECISDVPGTLCATWGDFAQVFITQASIENDNCARIEWRSTYARRLEDCYSIQEGIHWYGGGETYRQHWPIEQESRPEAPYVTGDSMAFTDDGYGGVTENYWLISSGAAIVVDETVPLFLSVNTTRANKFCFVGKDEYPFKTRDELPLTYSICLGRNIKEAHQASIHKFYPQPNEIPDENMILRPFWSTWAQFKEAVNQTIVVEFAQRIKEMGFISSHVEIDDHWETCYGEAEFNLNKFPDPAGMVQSLKELDFRVTLWVHPFINFDCPSFTTAVQSSFFVKDPKSKTGITSWWQGRNSGIIDFTDVTAAEWWRARLEKLRTEYGIDSFKFDAGETNWLPHSVQLTGDQDIQPNLYTTKFVDLCATFGKLIEVRSGRRNQAQPIFTRMLDKDSRWGYNNGLKSLIPTLLHFGIVGYPFVLPDMVGGNAYGDKPSRELYIRWMQANVFMPSYQFSIVPWDYDAEVIQITKDVLALREQYRDELMRAANQAAVDGSPINRPMWWVDPTDNETYNIDSQYMLGDEILVAPILEEGATRRDIYLPQGNWVGGFDTIVYSGPTWLRGYSAPIDVVPYFLKMQF